MDWQIAWLVFTAACSGHIFWQVGKKQGISKTLDYLKADGQIDFDEDWNLVLDIGGKICYNSIVIYK